MKEKLKEVMKKGKWLENTLITILLIFIIVAIVVGLNIFVEKQEISDIDLTKEKLYSLSEESKAKISSVVKDTKIILYNTGEVPAALDYAKLYNKENSHITYEELSDVTTRPDLQNKYGLGTVVTENVIIIETDGREKVISPSDFYTYDYTTYERYDVTEQVFTNAILDVNLEKNPNIYFVSNHIQNANYFQVIREFLKNEANNVEDLDLMVTAKVPEECDVLVLTTLKEDFSEYERDIIINYINNGGNMMILADPNAADINLQNFQTILETYGASISKGILYELNSSRMLYGYANVIIPNVDEKSEVTKYIASDGKIAVLNSGVINLKSEEELENLGITREDLITTTESSFQRTDITEESVKMVESDIKTSGEPIATVLTKKISDEKNSKLIICANSVFASDMVIDLKNTETADTTQMPGIYLYNNRDFIINSVSYLTNRKDNITVRKDTGMVTYVATAKEDVIIRTIITVIPVLIILAGIIVWQVRRRKK